MARLQAIAHELPTPGSINSLFSDLFREFGRGILGGVRDYLGETLGGFYTTNEGNVKDNCTRKQKKQNGNELQEQSHYIVLNSLSNDQGVYSTL